MHANIYKVSVLWSELPLLAKGVILNRILFCMHSVYRSMITLWSFIRFSHRGGSCLRSLTRLIRDSPQVVWRKMPGRCATLFPRALKCSVPSRSPRTSDSIVSDPVCKVCLVWIYRKSQAKSTAGIKHCRKSNLNIHQSYFQIMLSIMCTEYIKNSVKLKGIATKFKLSKSQIHQRRSCLSDTAPTHQVIGISCCIV